MEVAIRHYLPGRVRLHLPALCRKPEVAEAALVWLRAQRYVRSARINFGCACLVLEYDPTREGDLQTLLDRLRAGAFDGWLTAGGAPVDAGEDHAIQSDTKNSNVPPTKSEV